MLCYVITRNSQSIRVNLDATGYESHLDYVYYLMFTLI